MAQKDEEKKPYTYTPFDPNSSTAYTTASGNATSGYDAWNTHNQNGFNFTQQELLDTVSTNHNNWLNTKFNYDFNADALYQQYKDKYIKQGKMAMQDTMGQAAALTGGYGNSYAATVGNQAYQASLENLNDVIPELYQMAYSMHQDKGQNLLNQLNLLNNQKAFEYGTWVDKGNTLYNNMNYWQTEANNIYDRESTAHNTNESMLYQTARDAVADAQWEKNYLLNERQVALDENKFHYTTGEYIPKDANGNPIYGGVIDEGGGVVDEGGNNPSTGGITDAMIEKAKSFTDNKSLASYVDGLEASGVISEAEADYLFNQYFDHNEKYVETTDKNGNKVSNASYTDMIKSSKGWKVAYKGGGNFVGIDDNARVIDPAGNEIRLDKLRDKLTDEGMSKAKATDYIKQLQQALGISTNWFFGL